MLGMHELGAIAPDSVYSTPCRLMLGAFEKHLLVDIDVNVSTCQHVNINKRPHIDYIALVAHCRC